MTELQRKARHQAGMLSVARRKAAGIFHIGTKRARELGRLAAKARRKNGRVQEIARMGGLAYVERARADGTLESAAAHARAAKAEQERQCPRCLFRGPHECLPSSAAVFATRRREY